ncbi:alpha/beta fold hydrolase [Actinomycetospora endophytica]|uniref:Alpha/beta fold hydrolase n=1 Tax=Actinomycetospora endophytica TaxID=2291215 RepID=A0ABS8P1H1_9PSEU|nr:alpha/beta fold hydrolase [Actinomycetospora endophytica]MCD2192090.1 alpha/beta fold hydrolase [Actinomycetospora endophytica]
MNPPVREIRFLTRDDRRIAYERSGDGPLLICPAWWVSHLELDRDNTAVAHFWDAVGDGYSVVRYDRLGVGVSDRELRDDDATLDAEVEVIRAVADELDAERVSLLGGSSGGCAAIAFAARFPERVDRLVLYGAYADGASITQPEVREAILAAIRSHWGLGSRLLATIFLGDVSSEEREEFARFQRLAASAESAARFLEQVYRNDVRDQLALVRAPTHVVHRREDRTIPYRLGRQVAAGIPGATLVPLAGSAHFPWSGDAGGVVRALRTALSAGGHSHGPAEEPAAVLLSRREREVLDLVAGGLRDDEIAEQLVVSPHTVHRHVANIRRKLGRGSRTAAVAEAARLGLL